MELGEPRASGCGLGKHAVDFVWLLRGELFVLRTSWFWYVVQVSFVPLSYVVFLWLLVGRRDPSAMLFAVTGSWVVTISLGAMLSLGQHLGALKDRHAYEYYATLPISKAVFIAAVTTRGVLLSLPSLVVVMLVGRLAFGFAIPPAAVAILALSAYSMAGAGAVIGFWSPTAQVASLATQVLQTVITLLAPVFVPADSLPLPLRFTSWLWPTTHAALALRAVVADAPLAAYWPSVAALGAYVVVSVVLIPRRLEWRSR